MKLALIVPGFASHEGDPCIPVLSDVVAALSRGHEIHVFALRYPARRVRYRLAGATVHPIGAGGAHGLARIALLGAAFVALLGEQAAGPFDGVLGIWADEPGFLAVIASRLLRIPSLVAVMGGELAAHDRIGYGGRLSRVNRLILAIALRGANLVTSASEAEIARAAASMPQSARRRLRRVVWGVDPATFACTPSHPTGPGPLRALAAGSLTPVKDHSSLINAVALARRAGADIRLEIAGDGPLHDRLLLQIRTLGLENVVTLLGQLPRDSLSCRYRLSDVLVVSSVHEVQPAVALEALHGGLPVIGTAVGMMPDLVAAPQLAVPPGDARALAGALLHAARCHDCEATPLHRGSACRFSSAMTAEELVTLISEVTRQRTEPTEAGTDLQLRPWAGTR